MRKILSALGRRVTNEEERDASRAATSRDTPRTRRRDHSTPRSFTTRRSRRVVRLHSRCLGTHLMMSSTRMIISAASVPESKICCFTRKHSVIPHVAMSPTCPVRMSTPAVVSPRPWHARSCETISEESRPAFSQMMVGIALQRLGEALHGEQRFPEVFAASASTAFAHHHLGQPPPSTTRESFTVLVKTHSASCSERSPRRARATTRLAGRSCTPHLWRRRRT